MPRILIVGCGDLGGEIARLLHGSGHDVVGVRLSAKQMSEGMQSVQADVTQVGSIKTLQKLNPNIVVYCVAAKERTDESYYQHYVLGLKNVLDSQAKNKGLQHFFFVSSTRVYGQTTDKVLDEHDVAIPSDFGGERLLEAEDMLKLARCNTTALRLSGVYGKGRLCLFNQSKDISRWPMQNSFSNRIHRDDAARFIAFLCKKVFNKEEVNDCYIVADDMPTLQYEVLTWLASQQGIDISGIKVPEVNGGKQLSNLRLSNTGFKLQYPDYQHGYCEVLQHV